MSEMAQGRGEIIVARKKQALSEGMALDLSSLMRALLGREMVTWLERTAGIHEVLKRYEETYAALVRGRGKLTFSDLTRVLLGDDGGVLKGGDDPRLQLDYRLDARIDHWLLDEFQDTSRDQWRAIENLIDEAVQDNERGRSVFVVGDVKQSIYRFRGGEPKLASELITRYGEQLDVGAMPLSRRSRPAVISAVNLVFGDRAALGDVVPDEALARWQWEPHEAHFDEVDGYACLINPGGKAKEERFAVVLALLEKVQPVQQGVSCCILVQDNKTAGLLLTYLRENRCSSPCTSESDQVLISESPVCAALFSLLRASVHPGDELAWGHLKVTPLWPLILERGGRDAVVKEIREDAATHGYATAVARWREMLEEGAVSIPSAPSGGAVRGRGAGI